jgi:hypothetical protein
MMSLPEIEVSFFFAALAQLAPDARPIFTERVSQILGSHPAPDCGDVDRAIRAAFEALWVPPPAIDRPYARWHRSAASFERISKAAQPVVEVKRRHRRAKLGFGYVPTD